jgi:uncharacterized CHY-type Zn-finger protein
LAISFIVHLNGFSPVWVLTCWRYLSFVANCLPQCSHVCISQPRFLAYSTCFEILIRKFLIIYIFRFIIEHTQVNFLISATSVTKSSKAGTWWTIIKSLTNLKPRNLQSTIINVKNIWHYFKILWELPWLWSHGSWIYNYLCNLYLSQCNECHKKFKSWDMMNNHKITHKPKTIICDICGKVFSHRHRLSVHKKSHDAIGKHKCLFDDARFKTASNLHAHYVAKHVEYAKKRGWLMHACEHCGKPSERSVVFVNLHMSI